MPLQWSVSHPARLVLIVAKGEVLASEVGGLLEGLDRDKARPYRKIADIDGLESRFSDEQVRTFAAVVRARERETEVGPIAIIARDPAIVHMARLFVEQAEMNRPIQLFEEQHLARRWLEQIEAVLHLSKATPS